MTTQSRTDKVFVPERLDARTPLNDLLSRRWSPRAFSRQSVEPEKIASLLEAARCSPSSMNEQPWRFVIASQKDQGVYDAIAASLSEGNKRWAQQAPFLVVGFAQSTYAKTGAPYRHAWYDLGQSIAHLTIQASSVGLAVHQMGGFNSESLRQSLSVPEGFEAVIVLAIGYPGEPETLPEDLRRREQAPRTRKPLEAIVFTDTWGTPSHHVDSTISLLNSAPSSN